MTPRPKQIVIDKDAFIGINLDELCDFAKHHFLVAPGVLLYECAASKDRQKRNLLHRYEKLIREGACCCPHGQEFIYWEARHCRPHPLDLASEEGVTGKICNGDIQLESAIRPVDALEWERSRTRQACEKYINVSKIARQRIAQNYSNIREEIREFPSDRPGRLHFIMHRIDTEFDIRRMAVRSLSPELTVAEERFCRSDEWMTWHWMRLDAAIAFEYSYNNLKNGNTRGETYAEHDDQDSEYVFLLCRADAIITRDDSLVKPLARAAFPEKDVFSSLEEVPESYRCDWAQG